MRFVAVVAVALVAARSSPSGSEMARSICARNGHPVGAPGFDRCFETTFAAIMGAPVPAAPSGPVVFTRVGNAVVGN